LKPVFKESGESSLSARRIPPKGGKSRGENKGPSVMATIVSASRSTPAAEAAVEKPLAEFLAFWRAFLAKAFNPYRPELHYMRGPGPAWRAKHMRDSGR
jgi:hypothetical protein